VSVTQGERLTQHYTMSQQLMQSEKNTWGKGQVLAAVLAGDVAAATISATAISPILTVIDR